MAKSTVNNTQPFWIDIVLIYRDEKTKKEHQEKHHCKSMTEVLAKIISWQNPKIKGAKLMRVKFYEFFGNIVISTYKSNEFNLLPKYTEALESAKEMWQNEEKAQLRNDKIDSIVE